jgi:hypothetical protein
VTVAKESAVYLRRILFSVLDFAVKSGLDSVTIEKIVSEWMRSTQPKSDRAGNLDKSGLGADVDQIYGLVLHRWHREASLLDKDAKPRGLKLFGRTPSVEALVRAEGGNAPAKRVAQSLLSVGLIEKRKDGLYHPTSRVATVSKMHPMVVDHVSKSILRFLSTVRQNTSGYGSGSALIERYAQIPDLSKKELRKFKDFSQIHGTAFLTGVDDWLEPRRLKKKSRKGRPSCAAGIHVFAYVDEAERASAATPRAKRA